MEKEATSRTVTFQLLLLHIELFQTERGCRRQF